MNGELSSKLKRLSSVFGLIFFYIFGRFVKTKCRTFLRMAQKCTVQDIILPFHSAITCSKLTIETLEQEVKYVQR